MENETICWFIFAGLILGFVGWIPMCTRWCKKEKVDFLLDPENPH
jgi:hypothetical protein|tara:strand:+ start:32769 stop:32903 length:135 start_codon:yes stop_codon:yes gene_type:complete